MDTSRENLRPPSNYTGDSLLEKTDLEKKFGPTGEYVYRVMEEYLDGQGHVVEELAQEMPQDEAFALFKIFKQLIRKAKSDSEKIQGFIAEKFPDNQISSDEIFKSLMTRAQDMLYSVLEQSSLDKDTNPWDQDVTILLRQFELEEKIIDKESDRFVANYFALAEDPSIAGDLKKFMQKATPEQVNLVCLKYNEVIYSLFQIEEITANFYKAKGETVDPSQATEQIKEKARTLLKNAITSYDSKDFSKWEEKINKMNTDMTVFSAVYKAALTENPDITFEDIKDLSFETISIEDIRTQGKAQEMVRIAKEVYPGPSVSVRLNELLNPQEQGKEIADIPEFKIDDVEFAMVERKGEKDEIVSFIYIGHIDENTVYLSFYSINEAAKCSGIGGKILEEVLKKYSEKNDLKATAKADGSIGTYYIDRVGFIADGFDPTVEFEEDYPGRFKLEMLKDDPKYRLREKSMSKSKLISIFKKDFADNDPLNHIGEKSILMEYDTADMETMINIFDQLLNKEGYKITRYFCLDKNCDKRLVGFEK